MFTGLIEALGTVTLAQAPTFEIETTPEILATLALGDSIAVDGVCTTVTAKTSKMFRFHASPETLIKTTMNHYAVGQKVNLERPLKATDRIGGHFVTGHVDGLATLHHKTPATAQIDSGCWALTFSLHNADLAPLLVQKGSVAISGISLTVNTVSGTDFSVMLIPHTLKHTTLKDLAIGQLVNIETDILGKYVQNFYQHGIDQKKVLQEPTALCP